MTILVGASFQSCSCLFGLRNIKSTSQGAFKTSKLWRETRPTGLPYTPCTSTKCLKAGVAFGKRYGIRWWLHSQMLSCQLRQILGGCETMLWSFSLRPLPRPGNNSAALVITLLHYCYCIIVTLSLCAWVTWGHGATFLWLKTSQ